MVWWEGEGGGETEGLVQAVLRRSGSGMVAGEKQAGCTPQASARPAERTR